MKYTMWMLIIGYGLFFGVGAYEYFTAEPKIAFSIPANDPNNARLDSLAHCHGQGLVYDLKTRKCVERSK